MKARENFSIAVNPYPRALDGSDRVVYSHMVYITREEPNMDKNELLRAIMKHAVTGHDNDGTSFNTFCSDPQHALDMIDAEGMILHDQLGKALSTADDEGMDEIPYGAHPIYPNARSEQHA